jgi:hypothetical protein
MLARTMGSVSRWSCWWWEEISGGVRLNLCGESLGLVKLLVELG